MGLFSFFTKKKEELAVVAKTLPTVKADPEMLSSYKQVFFDVMADVDGFTPEEFSEMVQFILDGDGGYMNMAHYYKPVFHNYFSGRHWTWAEYDYWERTYEKMGNAPLHFPAGLAVSPDRAIELTTEEALKNLKVVDLKDLSSPKA